MLRGQMTQLQDPFLNEIRKEQIPVFVFLVNGIKLQGKVEAFDQDIIILQNVSRQMIYKHAVSTVVPSRDLGTIVSNNHTESEAIESSNK